MKIIPPKHHLKKCLFAAIVLTGLFGATLAHATTQYFDNGTVTTPGGSYVSPTTNTWASQGWPIILGSSAPLAAFQYVPGVFRLPSPIDSFYYFVPTDSNAEADLANNPSINGSVSNAQECDNAASAAGLSPTAIYWCVVSTIGYNNGGTTGGGNVIGGGPITMASYGSGLLGYNVQIYSTPPITQYYAYEISPITGVETYVPPTVPVGPNGSCYTDGGANGYYAPSCSIIQSIPVQQQPPAPTATLYANPTSVTQGNSSTLTWGSVNATSCTGSGFSTANQTSGTAIVTPSATTDYGVTCTGAGGSASADAPVTVTPLATAPTETLTPAPRSITRGNSSQLAWTSSANATYCAATNFTLTQHQVQTGGQTCFFGFCFGPPAVTTNVNDTSGSVPVSPTSTTQYSYSCGNSVGTTTATATVTVTNTPQVATISSCMPSPSSAAPNAQVTWTASVSGFSPAPTRYSWSVTGGSPSLGSGAADTFTSSFASGGNSYAPSVTATNGTQTAGPTSCTPVSITSSGGACSGPATPSLSATPNRVNPSTNNGTTLTYGATGITPGQSCVIMGPGMTPKTTAVANSSCSVAGGTATTSKLTTQSVYTITCGSGSGTATTTVVNVLPTFQEF